MGTLTGPRPLGSLPPDPRDRAVKRDRVLAVLEAAGVGAVELRSAAATSWYLDGARTHVSLAAEPVVTIRVSPGGDLVRVPEAERDRLIAEELPSGIEVEGVPWYAGPATVDAAAESTLAAPLRAARAALLPAETARLRALGADAASVLTQVLHDARPTDTEVALAARVAAGIVGLGADPLVVLVAGSQRRLVRHPLPTDARLGARAMVVLCARRSGLIVNLTRWVQWGSASTAQRAADRAILEVEAAYWGAVRTGATLADVLRAGAAAYGAAGFDPDEWRRHHQGGAAGYAGRDPRASLDTADVVHDGQAFAWNPSAPGAKVEDTVLFAEGRIDVLTLDPGWPTILHEGTARPDILTR